MEHRNQHWIPRSYLKEWCDPLHKNSVIHRYDREGRYVDWRPPSRVFSENDLYTTSKDGQRNVDVEVKFLKALEDVFLKVRARIEKEPVLTPQAKRALTYFVSVMRNRSPAARDHWQNFKDRIVKAADQMAEAIAKATPAERLRMAQALRSPMPSKGGSISHEEAKAAAAQPFGEWLPRHAVIEAKLLERLTLTVLKAPDGIGFITSDSPVVWHDAAHKIGDRRRRIGLGYKYIEVTMPISPSMCLLFDHTDRDGVAEIDQEAVDIINSRTLGQCEVYIIANSPDLVVDWFEVEVSEKGEEPAPS